MKYRKEKLIKDIIVCDDGKIIEALQAYLIAINKKKRLE